MSKLTAEVKNDEFSEVVKKMSDFSKATEETSETQLEAIDRSDKYSARSLGSSARSYEKPVYGY